MTENQRMIRDILSERIMNWLRGFADIRDAENDAAATHTPNGFIWLLAAELDDWLDE